MYVCVNATASVSVPTLLARLWAGWVQPPVSMQFAALSQVWVGQGGDVPAEEEAAADRVGEGKLGRAKDQQRQRGQCQRKARAASQQQRGKHRQPLRTSRQPHRLRDTRCLWVCLSVRKCVCVCATLPLRVWLGEGRGQAHLKARETACLGGYWVAHGLAEARGHRLAERAPDQPSRRTQGRPSLCAWQHSPRVRLCEGTVERVPRQC
jgi:hypothetical protein